MNFFRGHYWTSVHDGTFTYYIMNGVLKESEFGKTNNYVESYVRDYLVNSELATELKKDFGDKLIPISLDLTALDGLKDYGMVEGDILAIPNIQLILKFGERIPLINYPYWLSTPNQTLARKDSHYVQCVVEDGYVTYRFHNTGGIYIRPFFILQT